MTAPPVILLVEDDPDALDFLALILRQTGATVSAFPLAAPAFDFYSHSERLPDIVVSDIAMPTEDGYSLMWRLRAWELNHGRIPVPAVAVSAFARDEDVQRAQAAVQGLDHQRVDGDGGRHEDRGPSVRLEGVAALRQQQLGQQIEGA